MSKSPRSNVTYIGKTGEKIGNFCVPEKIKFHSHTFVFIPPKGDFGKSRGSRFRRDPATGKVVFTVMGHKYVQKRANSKTFTHV